MVQSRGRVDQVTALHPADDALAIVNAGRVSHVIVKSVADEEESRFRWSGWSLQQK